MNRVALCLSVLTGSIACAQDAPTARSAAELLEQLRAAGVELPDGFVANEDGSVSLPPAAPSGDDQAPVEDVVPGSELPEVVKPEWNTKLNMGLNVSSGNTDQIGFAGTIVSRRTTPTSELTLDAGYYFANEDGDDTENKFTAGVLHDWLFKDSKWLIFADARYDFDEFKSFEHRFATHAGVGYRFIDKEKMKLTLRAGAGIAKEFGSERNEIIPEALAGLDFWWQIAENQSFELSHRFYPDLIESGEFRTLTTAGWRLALDQGNGLSFTVNALHEYVSDVDPGVDESDLKLFAGISYEF